MSGERRMEGQKAIVEGEESMNRWFESLSLHDREVLFFESKSFEILIEKFKKRLDQMQENVKEHEIFLRVALDNRKISYGLGNIILKTPTLFGILHNNENIAKYITNREADVARRLFAIFSYPNSIPSEAYNLDKEWEGGKSGVSEEVEK